MYSEADEVKGEVRRLRPEWLRAKPDLTLFKRLRYDWTRSRGSVWDRMPYEAVLLQQHDEEMLQRAREQAKALRVDALGWSPKWRTATLTMTIASRPSPMAGWSGEPVEAWRFDGLNVFMESIRRSGHPLIEWLEGEVNIGMMIFESAALTTFWLHEVELTRMPRHWLRWAFEFLQRQHKVTPGTPADAQLGTYLLEADLMLSADKVFVSIAEKCRLDAPFHVAKSRVVSGAMGL